MLDTVDTAINNHTLPAFVEFIFPATGILVTVSPRVLLRNPGS